MKVFIDITVIEIFFADKFLDIDSSSQHIARYLAILNIDKVYVFLCVDWQVT